MNRKGLTLPEILISSTVLAVLMLGTAEFASNVLGVSHTASEQMKNIHQLRVISERVATEIADASYIYPANVELELHGYSSYGGMYETVSVNTNDALAILTEDEPYDGYIVYGLTAYYFKDLGDGRSDLYEFVSYPSYEWDNNTSPATESLVYYGNITRLVKDVRNDTTELEYVLNYGNGITDAILKGEVGGVATNNPNALIKGVEWEISQENTDKHTVTIRSVSRNVPRFFEE